jgi:hypothetical protein
MGQLAAVPLQDAPFRLSIGAAARVTRLDFDELARIFEPLS